MARKHGMHAGAQSEKRQQARATHLVGFKLSRRTDFHNTTRTNQGHLAPISAVLQLYGWTGMTNLHLSRDPLRKQIAASEEKRITGRVSECVHGYWSRSAIKQTLLLVLVRASKRGVKNHCAQSRSCSHCARSAWPCKNCHFAFACVSPSKRRAAASQALSLKSSPSTCVSVMPARILPHSFAGLRSVGRRAMGGPGSRGQNKIARVAHSEITAAAVPCVQSRGGWI